MLLFILYFIRVYVIPVVQQLQLSMINKTINVSKKQLEKKIEIYSSQSYNNVV